MKISFRSLTAFRSYFCVRLSFVIFAVILLLDPSLYAGISRETLKETFAEGVTVDLKDPTYSDGVLKAEKGGVITGSDLRIQAINILYTKRVKDNVEEHQLIAEGDLFVKYGSYLFIGDRLEYDFITNEGVLYNGRSNVEPWYFGGDEVYFHEDGSIEILDGYLTTSGDINPDWQLKMERILLTKDHFITANNVKFKYDQFSLFWFPIFKTKLDWLLDSPVRFRVRTGGKQGLRFGVIYEAITTPTFTSFVRFDYRLNRGPAVGIETVYESPDGLETFNTINYVARDSSIIEPSERFRYRFEGVYSNLLDGGRTSIDLSYDKISDIQMPSDYYDKSLDLKTSGRTQLDVRRQHDDLWISNFFTRLRVNDFQTVKEELPTATFSMHPIQIGDTGIILENQVKGGFLDYQYSNDVDNSPDYHSSRVEVEHKIYKPFFYGPLTITPEAKGIGIYYGNSPSGSEQVVATAILGGEVKTLLHRYYDWGKHVMIPYSTYQYVIEPTEPPPEHYIFDIQDGWYTLSALRWGVRNLFYCGNPDQGYLRGVTADAFAYAFFDNKTMLKTVPKIYGRLIWNTFPTMRNTINAAWDLERNIVDHFNFRTDWTISENFAVAAEYRHRSDYAWRKNVPFNFILESFRPEFELRHSSLSDRRDTILTHFYYQFLGNWSAEFRLHHGWRRRTEPSYTEYQWDVGTTLPSNWKLRLSYQMKEDDHRVALYISLDLNRPRECRSFALPMWY